MRRATRNLVTAIVGLVASLALAGEGQRQRCLEYLGPAMTIPEVQQGSLLFRTADRNRFVPAPTQSTDVSIVGRGLVARATVAQRFTNLTDEWLEGVYVFPLPADAAVDRMRMKIGERVVEGQVREREEARKVYQQAAREGRKASLVEQERPNAFTTSVANIGPGEEVEVEIEYQQTVRYEGGSCELRFPMVVGPRYIPGEPVEAGEPGTGWAFNTTEVTDAERITPPVVPPGLDPVNPVSLRVSLDMGLPLNRLLTPYHAVQITHPGGSEYRVELDAHSVPADRDFVLEWAVAAGREPQAALFTEELERSRYALLMVVPPSAEQADQVRLPREMVLVVDTSGSMHGASIEQARQALLFALKRLHPDDFFNVIRFSSGFSSLFPESRQAFPATVEEARQWVTRLEAGGGTEMLPALRQALVDRSELTPVRQVVFVTDGCVGNEEHLFGVIAAELGRSRLFTVGIGSAPNAHFMERAAAFGRGTFTFIGQPTEVETNMTALLDKLADPVLHGIAVRWPDPAAEAWPERISDLYGSEPVVVAARLATLDGEVVVSGSRGLEPWEVRLPVEIGAERGGVHQLWARCKLAALEDRIARGTSRDEVRTEMIAVALEHHLVSRFTSLVAVDVTPSRPDGEGMVQRPVATNLPHGWSYEQVFGSLPQGGTASRLCLLAGLLLLGLAGLLHRIGLELR